jgi:hypothetical protein
LVLITLNFKVNQGFYIEICENKNKPEMECNGKCHLKKQIQEREAEKSKEKKLLPQRDNEIFIKKITIFLPQPHTLKLKHKPIHIPHLKQRLPLFEIFHPPQYQV